MTGNPTFLDRRFDSWTQNLLDLSKRNRLLYFKPQPNTTIQLLEPDLPTIWQRLVLKNRTLLFHGLEIEEDLFNDDEEGDLDTTIQRPLGVNELRPDLSSTRLSKTLSYLRQRSRTSLEEQGVVTLFVAFGFLKWNEKGKNGLPGDDVFSPLLLVPVSLHRESARKPYTLKLWEDEVALNPVLKFRLHTEAKIQLPEPPDADDLDLLSYFQDVERAVAKQPGWSVWEAAYLGLFSFHKIAMYRDLQDNRDRVLSHPLVKALAGDSESVPVVPDDLPQGSQLDDVSPHEAWQVVDADSSQQEAIQAARRGVSFVLQGPPGTGKSQTITNIIAECLSDGKKVLFVSEKMAALQVVFNRLSQSGLADFCLEAHSHKANKRAVVQELDRTLHATRKAAPSSSTEADQLSSLRKNLNDYARELHRVHQPAELSAYEVSGYLAQLHDAPQLMFSYHAPSKVSPALRTQISDYLREMARLHQVLATHETHPWAGCNLRDAGLQTRDELRVRFERLSQNLQVLDGALSDVLDKLGLMRFPDWRMTNRVLELVGHLETSPCPPREWLEDDELTLRRQVAQELSTRISSYLARSADLSISQNISFLSLPHQELEDRLTTRPEKIIHHIANGVPDTNGNIAGDIVLSRREALSSSLTQAVNLLNTLQQQSSSLAATLQIDAPQTLAQTVAVTTLANHVVQNPQPQAHWFEAGALISLEEKIQAATKRDQAIATAEGALRDFDHEALQALDLDDWIARFDNSYASAMRVVNPAFHRDCKTLKSLHKEQKKLSASEYHNVLRSAQQLKQLVAEREDNRTAHIQDFRRLFNGSNTDWDQIISSLHCCAAIIENRGGQVPEGLQRVLITSGDAIEIAAAKNTQLKSTLHQLQAALKSLHDVFPLRNFPFSDLPVPHLSLEALRLFLQEAQQRLNDFFAAYDAANIAQKQSTLTEIITALREGAAIEKEKQELEQRGDECRALFSHFDQGLQTPWPKVLEAIAWTEQLRSWFGGNPVPEQVLDVAINSGHRIQNAADLLRAAKQSVDEDWLFLSRTFPQLQINSRPLENTALPEAASWVKERVARIDGLEEWLSWVRLQELSTHLGLHDFWNCALREKPNAQEIEGAFFRRFWSLWLDEVFSSSPALQHFSGATHQANIERFCEIDVSLLEVSRNRLPAQLARDKPKPGATRGGEIAILQREALKKTRHKPLRQLFGEIPNVLQALKPCMLMSPLSVAQYLTPGKLQFDLVIFDEASQICSEDAIGAITRGAQLIVVGDRKQLPPSRFFGSADVADDEESEEEGGETYESILDECATIGLPDKMLRWHYRSRNEELIAFSNRHFYESNLVTFPGPYTEGGGIRGVSFEKVNGTYIRGKGKNARTNPIEAKRVAELVVEHLQNSAHESLGVIAFNEAQMRAILTELQNYARSNPYLDALLYNSDEKEPFFVKNLENVQGDERDVIIFSIGYGPDENGKFSMNFGPLNRAGGERRLNVAVTRARHRVKVVASFEPDAIETHRVSASGPKLLAQYLAFAKNGGAQMLSTHNNSLSTVEESIAQTLESRGWEIHRNVGFSDMRVDLAVLDPDNPERFLLGIECDGPSYMQAQTARDRDRLRIHVLKELGWNLVRIWSPDWIKNRNAQIARIEQALEAAKSKPTIIQQAAIAATQTLPQFNTIALSIQSSNIPATTATNSVSATQTTMPLVATNASHTQVIIPAASPSSNQDDDKPNSATRVLSSGTVLPDGVTIYRECKIPYQGSASSFYTLAESRPSPIEMALTQVVKFEGPIHIAVATRRVVAGWGMGRAGAKLLDIISKAAYRAQNRQLLQIRGEFLWPAEMQQPPVRAPQYDTPRPVGEIAPEEIAEAAFLCVQHSFAVTREELIHQTARLLGFRQTGTNVRTGIETALLLLEQDKRVRVADDTFTIMV